VRIILFIALCLFGHTTLTFADQSSSQRLEKVQSELESLSTSIKNDKKTKDELYRQLKQQSKIVSKLNREQRELTQQLEEKNQQLKLLEQEQKAYRQSHASQLSALSNELRSAYINAKPNYLKLLLSQQEPSKLNRSSTYFKYFHQARQQQLADINSSLLTLSTQQQQLVETQQQQQQLYTQHQQQKLLLNQQNEQRLATAKQLELKLDKQSLRIKQLREEENALQALIKSLSTPKKIITAKPAVNYKFAQHKGSLLWPVNGKVIAHYGSPRNLGKLTWQGIMIKATTGKEIAAAAPGQIVFADWLRGYGLLLIVDHGDKYMTLYGHNQTLLKEVGDIINTGDIIALSGDKSANKQAGLYFEIRHKGNPTNPTQWLSKKS
jgi:septal ring factor EnvC (AmiA/AmiB activator)